MDYQSLLVHIDDSDQSDQRLDLAARLARKFDAELAGAYLVPTRELTPFTSAMLPDSVVEHRLRDSGDAQARAEARFRAAADREGLRGRRLECAGGPADRRGDLACALLRHRNPRTAAANRRSRRIRQRPRAFGADGRRAAGIDRSPLRRISQRSARPC